MSTRSLVGLATGDGFTNAVYVHSDGYPTGRGPTLFKIAENLGSVQALWDALDSAKNTGWSYLDPEYLRDTSFLGDRGEQVPGVGMRYTDAQSDEDWRFDWHGEPLGRHDGGAEWAYAIEPTAETLTIFKVEGMNSEVRPIAVVRFGDDVDWDAIEEAGYESLASA